MKQSSSVASVKYKRTQEQERRLQGLLLKEVFRRFLIKRNVADQFVIDTHSFTRLPNKIGCFSSDGKWIVYETDDHSDVTDIQEYALPMPAFRDTASRHGLVFRANKYNRAQFEALFLDSAIKNAETVVDNLRGTETCAAVNDDVIFLRKQKRIANTLRQVAERTELYTDNTLPTISSTHTKGRTKANTASSSNQGASRRSFRMGKPYTQKRMIARGAKYKVIYKTRDPLDSKKKITGKEKLRKEG